MVPYAKIMDDLTFILPNPPPTRSDALRNRAVILRTAQRLFTEQGVDAVSMTAVADEAGVGKGTLYRHFESKAELIEALLDEDQRDLQTQTFQRLRTHRDALENLSWFLHEGLSFVERNRGYLCAGMDNLASLRHPAHWWWRQTIRGLLAQLPIALDCDYAADLLYVMLDIHTVSFQRIARSYSIEQIEAGLLATLKRLLR